MIWSQLEAYSACIRYETQVFLVVKIVEERRSHKL